MEMTSQTSKKRFEMNSSEYQSLQRKIMEGKADFNTLLDAIIADPNFQLQERMDTIDAYFKKWQTEFRSLGLLE